MWNTIQHVTPTTTTFVVRFNGRSGICTLGLLLKIIQIILMWRICTTFWPEFRVRFDSIEFDDLWNVRNATKVLIKNSRWNFEFDGHFNRIDPIQRYRDVTYGGRHKEMLIGCHQFCFFASGFFACAFCPQSTRCDVKQISNLTDCLMFQHIWTFEITRIFSPPSLLSEAGSEDFPLNRTSYANRIHSEK